MIEQVDLASSRGSRKAFLRQPRLSQDLRVEEGLTKRRVEVRTFFQPLDHSFTKKHLLGVCYLPETMFDTRNAAVDPSGALPSLSVQSSGEDKY